jgi:hypothetical protein
VKKVGFEAAIVELKVKRLASEDKSMRLTLQVDSPGDDLIDDLNQLFRPSGSRVGVAIAEKVDEG